MGGLPSTVSHSLPLVGALDGRFPDCETSDLEVALSVSLKNTQWLYQIVEGKSWNQCCVYSDLEIACIPDSWGVVRLHGLGWTLSYSLETVTAESYKHIPFSA